ncbi:MAG: GNAT family N-acetyltransferase [Gemmatimonadetes bacterium]|jgi:GNAT superfamily N-acetyltransferase|nr:GNAT family N-acetyltransferase [Gemmatimonadota bacterium]MBT6144628.1 GNAT family N-acetyltransferase [Gemmatimonadota bacterium]MBT7863922.1 GNAT family N-acetyltransferase [Gemmatimonadota bacterium]
MSASHVQYHDDRAPSVADLVELYGANDWSSARKPELLCRAMHDSHTVITAWDSERLVGLGNAISDGHLVVYYPHLLVHPAYHRQGIGTAIVRRLQARYEGFHQQMIVADGAAIAFYEKLGFSRAGATQSMWIYDGGDH